MTRDLLACFFIITFALQSYADGQYLGGGTADVGGGTADVGGGTADVGGGTADVGGEPQIRLKKLRKNKMRKNAVKFNILTPNTTFRLDNPGEVMENIPWVYQSDLFDCYAHAAHQLFEAQRMRELILQGQEANFTASSPLSVALTYARFTSDNPTEAEDLNIFKVRLDKVSPVKSLDVGSVDLAMQILIDHGNCKKSDVDAATLQVNPVTRRNLDAFIKQAPPEIVQSVYSRSNELRAYYSSFRSENPSLTDMQITYFLTHVVFPFEVMNERIGCKERLKITLPAKVYENFIDRALLIKQKRTEQEKKQLQIFYENLTNKIQMNLLEDKKPMALYICHNWLFTSDKAPATIDNCTSHFVILMGIRKTQEGRTQLLIRDSGLHPQTLNKLADKFSRTHLEFDKDGQYWISDKYLFAVTSGVAFYETPY